MTIADLVHAAAARWPDRIAVIDEQGPLTFAALAADVRALTLALKAAGLRPRQGLGVVARNGRGFLTAVFAGLGCGAVIMPIFHQLRRREIAAQVQDVGLHAVVDDGSIAPLPGDLGPPLPCGLRLTRLPRFVQEPDAAFVPHVPDAAFVRFTSGTTGAAKGVVLGEAAVLARTEAAREALDLGVDDTVIWVLPMAYHFVVSVVMYVRYGVRIAVCPDVFAGSILDAAETWQGTLLYASPMHYRLLAADTSGRRFSHLRRAVSTSSSLPGEVARSFQERFGLAVSQVYGIIEVGIPVGNDDPGGHPEAIGHAMPGYEAAILDDDGEPVEPGATGHLALRGVGMFDAYLTPPTVRDEVMCGGWFYTGDLGWQAPDGRITVSGRRKSMINVAGHKVFPEEVEALLDARPEVAASRVFGAPHPVMGEVVVAEVVAAAGAVVEPEALRRYCQERLSGHKVPQRISVVETVPTTGSGKVARAEITR